MMPPFIIDPNGSMVFPAVSRADDEGLLAIGGDLSSERLLLAYKNGIFPWYQGDYILWWSPDPRFVLFPEELHISKSMQKFMRKAPFQFRVNTAFSSVIKNCKEVYRPDQDGTWITDEMEQAYIRLHHQGYAHSAEAWNGDRLVGGVYGIRMGPFFFGESMFSLETNASKFAFIQYVQQLQQEGLLLVDCQVYAPHTETLGARMIPRSRFIEMLDKYLSD